MGSKRLPGKVLLSLFDKPLLLWMIERVVRAKSLDGFAIATSTDPKDDPIAALCSSAAITYIRGSEEDVLQRYHEAAQALDATVIVRLTADCPLIDPAIIDKVVNFYRDNYPFYDYVSNTLVHSFPRGMDVEVFSMESLATAYREALSSTEREHVTPFIYRHPDRFRLGNVAHSRDLSIWRWTVDELEDFTLIRNLVTALYPSHPHFSFEELIAIMEANPEWHAINAHVEQKKCN